MRKAFDPLLLVLKMEEGAVSQEMWTHLEASPLEPLERSAVSPIPCF